MFFKNRFYNLFRSAAIKTAIDDIVLMSVESLEGMSKCARQPFSHALLSLTLQHHRRPKRGQSKGLTVVKLLPTDNKLSHTLWNVVRMPLSTVAVSDFRSGGGSRPTGNLLCPNRWQFLKVNGLQKRHEWHVVKCFIGKVIKAKRKPHCCLFASVMLRA